jgi:hypothetical protein
LRLSSVNLPIDNALNTGNRCLKHLDQIKNCKLKVPVMGI